MKKTPHPVDQHVGARMRMRRELVGASQVQLGSALGVTFQQVQKYEKGANRVSASRLQQIGDVLHVPVAYFFEGAPRDSSIEAADIDSANASAVLAFLATAEGLQLAKAFVRVGDAKMRRSIIEFVEAVADQSPSMDLGAE